MLHKEVWLNVAEKPSVAKEASSVLSNGQCRTSQTLSRFNPVFEFDLSLGGASHQMLFTSVAGHIMEDDFPKSAKSWAAVPFADLFHIPIERRVKEDCRSIEQNLQALAPKASVLVLWLDCDREGENICFEVMGIVQRRNPRIGVRRAHFSALTPRDLFGAVNNLGEPNRLASNAVEARQEMDLRIGAAFTRFQTLTLRDQFEGIPKVVSFGPCQFPCLGFVVKRHWERQRFVPESYYWVELSCGSTTFTWSRKHIYCHRSAVALYSELMTNAAKAGSGERAASTRAVVTNVRNKTTTKHSPVPLATVELERLAAVHLRMPAERCLALAEALYQEGIISYPRTETDHYTFTDEELKQLVQLHSSHPKWGSAAQKILEGRYQRPHGGPHNDNAHPPIHPLKAVAQLNDDAKMRLYELIVRHFLASMSGDAAAAFAEAEVTYGGEEFHTSGQTVLDRAWLDIFFYERWGSGCLPNFTVGQSLTPDAVVMHEGTTQPPPLLSEANLITMMDQHGIGTDATIAQHIKTIQDREYVTVERCLFSPTPLGVALATAYSELGLSAMWEPQLRAQTEAAMRDILCGSISKEAVVRTAIQQYEGMLERVVDAKGAIISCVEHFLPRVANAPPIATTNACITHCPLCSHSVTLKRSKPQLPLYPSGRPFVGCTAFPECAYVIFLPPCEDARVLPSRCACGAAQVLFRFSPVQIIPGMDPEVVSCLFCDPLLQPHLTVRNDRQPCPARTFSYASAAAAGQSLAHSSSFGNCDCGVPAKRCVSQRAQSKGRAFLTCGNNKTCKFFVWED